MLANRAQTRCLRATFHKEGENNFHGYFSTNFGIYATGIRRTGFRRIREYSYHLENERTHQVYGQATAINKLLIVNGEAYPGRITIVLVKQQLGF